MPSMKQPFLIAGPCSAETREQVLETAAALVDAHLKPDFFRAGIWKPRTRPGDFEGVGAIGLPWLKEVKENYQLPVAIEVAKAEHVELALKYGVDMVWIGARSTANPFTVQEIADALSGVNIPVYVKNPTNPDLKLWLGGIERVFKANVGEIAAIHRGFSVYEKNLYRNNPNWQIPIDLKQEMPEIRLICDPSHIGGRDFLLFDIAQKALDLRFDGLIIETHIRPKEAWTDARQQITPSDLKVLIDNIQLRSREEIPDEILKEHRLQLNQIDEDLIRLLQERMQIAEKIGAFKKEHNSVILQSNRWEEVLKKNVTKASGSGLSVQFSNELFRLIHQESIRIQAAILAGKNNE